MSETEFQLLQTMIKPLPGQTLLDVGCGTGHFTRRFANLGLQTTGLDPDMVMLKYAASLDHNIHYLAGTATDLPFANAGFDHCTAITSLCFVEQPDLALQEMWSVCRKTLTLGLLNRKSLLYREKYNKGAYRGARWDSRDIVRKWISMLEPLPRSVTFRTAVFTPGECRYQRMIENVIPQIMPFGAFLAVRLLKEYT